MRRGGSSAAARAKNKDSALARARWVTAAEAAKYLSVSAATVLRRARRGEIPATVLSRGAGPKRSRTVFRFRLSDLDAWAESHRVGPKVAT